MENETATLLTLRLSKVVLLLLCMHFWQDFMRERERASGLTRRVFVT